MDSIDNAKVDKCLNFKKGDHVERLEAFDLGVQKYVSTIRLERNTFIDY